MPLELSLFSKAQFAVSPMRGTPWAAMAASSDVGPGEEKGEPGPVLQVTGMPFGDIPKAASTSDLKPLNSHMAVLRAIPAISHGKHVSKSGAEIGKEICFGGVDLKRWHGSTC